MPQSDKEILRQRLFQLLRLQNSAWLVPSMFAGVVFLFPLEAFPSIKRILEGWALFWVSIPFFLAYQAITFWWIHKLRKTLQTATPAQAHSYYIGNIVFGAASFVLLPICGALLRDAFCVFGGFSIAVLLFVPLAKVNRLILAIYENKESGYLASPCPEVFYQWDGMRTFFWLPFIMFAMIWLFILIVALFTRSNPFTKLVFTLSGVFSAIGCIFWPISIPNWLVKQTDNPSPWQRIIREVSWLTMNMWSKEFPAGEKTSFQWWLSHPGEPWPENMERIALYIDTDSFDWQDPNEWKAPIQKAQAQAHHQRPESPVIENLVIGSQAAQMEQHINTQPVFEITSLFKAVMNNNLADLQGLLPNSNLNRPFAETGNTPLHIAALNGYTDIVRLLLEQPNIDTTRTNNAGQTALDLAREKEFKEIVKLLGNKQL